MHVTVVIFQTLRSTIRAPSTTLTALYAPCPYHVHKPNIIVPLLTAAERQLVGKFGRFAAGLGV